MKCQLKISPGFCCCRCKFQEKICCHPWNETVPFKGNMGEFFGYGCTVFLALREHDQSSTEEGIIFQESVHGVCEMFTKEKPGG